jgi:hypothetical protein
MEHLQLTGKNWAKISTLEVAALWLNIFLCVEQNGLA